MKYLLIIFLLLAAPAVYANDKLMEEKTIEVHSRIKDANDKTIALTLDLCMGKTDYRILQSLIDNNVKATFFATELWLKNNPEAIKLIKEHEDLFDIENHGKNHIPAVDNIDRVYNIKTAGSLSAIKDEVLGGASAITSEGFKQPIYYRTATARYSPDAIKFIENLGYQIGGFSINGDYGASVSSVNAYNNILQAQNGDIVIAHMNHPERPSGEGVAKAIAALKQKNYHFVKLSDVKITHLNAQ